MASARVGVAAERVTVKRAPTEADLDEAEMDAELLSGSDITLKLSDRAAEVRPVLLSLLLRLLTRFCELSNYGR
jgi:phage terminase Nu1 subunit (DNA packaging protein)